MRREIVTDVDMKPVRSPRIKPPPTDEQGKPPGRQRDTQRAMPRQMRDLGTAPWHGRRAVACRLIAAAATQAEHETRVVSGCTRTANPVNMSSSRPQGRG